MPKNVQITIQLHSFHTKQNNAQHSPSQASTVHEQNFQMFKLDLEKAEEQETKSPTSIGIIERAREFQKNIYFCFIDYAKAFDCMDHNKWKILKEMGIPYQTT